MILFPTYNSKSTVGTVVSTDAVDGPESAAITKRKAVSKKKVW